MLNGLFLKYCFIVKQNSNFVHCLVAIALMLMSKRISSVLVSKLYIVLKILSSDLSLVLMIK